MPEDSVVTMYQEDIDILLSRGNLGDLWFCAIGLRPHSGVLHLWADYDGDFIERPDIEFHQTAWIKYVAKPMELYFVYKPEIKRSGSFHWVKGEESYGVRIKDHDIFEASLSAAHAIPEVIEQLETLVGSGVREKILRKAR